MTTDTVPQSSDHFEKPEELDFDLMNPRITGRPFENEKGVIKHFVEHADVDELIQSIQSSGWQDYEPLIVFKEDEKKIVLEGNRRLAALRILSNSSLREEFKLKFTEKPGRNALPENVRVRYVKSRKEARDFIGFKHINGAFKWDALAKAKYAAEWCQDEGNIEEISRRLGDNHNTVVRLINGWNILDQSTKKGFDRDKITKKLLHFSHLYTAITRPNVRSYLGLPSSDPYQLLCESPVPDEKIDNLQRLMSWLYGQGDDEPSIIKSQNPNLNQLADVLGNQTAQERLEYTRDLSKAYDLIEDKVRKFSQELTEVNAKAEDTLGLAGHYDGQKGLMTIAIDLHQTTKALCDTMEKKRENLRQG